MLSILIPTYDYTIYNLVCELKKQCDIQNIEYEIIVQDDASNSVLNLKNEEINVLPNCFFYINNSNFGRSKNRNTLALRAKFDWILFLDADTFPNDPCFIENYLNQMDKDIDAINGGITYQKQQPNFNELLRWYYGKKRESLSAELRNRKPYLSFLTLNFLIKKEVMLAIPFNENIPNLRHEDTVFSYGLKIKKIKILHIDNSVQHNGLETSSIFLRKSTDSVENLKYLVENNLISTNYVSLYKLFFKIKKLNLDWVLKYIYNNFLSQFEKNLLGKNPSLLVFDCYRLCYLCSL